jgi:DNA-binding response OmpR family regulator
MAAVLIIDDKPELRTLLEAAVRREGHTVLSAADAHQAWELLQANNPSLVLSDVALPGENGVDLVLRMRADARYVKTPVVFVTASPEAPTLFRKLEPNVPEVLQKPFRFDDIGRLMKKYIKVA